MEENTERGKKKNFFFGRATCRRYPAFCFFPFFIFWGRGGLVCIERVAISGLLRNTDRVRERVN